MTKFKKTFVPDIQAKIDFEKEQEELKQKHNLETDKVVVEKSNMVKFTVNTVKEIIRTLASILVFILAAIGLVACISRTKTGIIGGMARSIYAIKKLFIVFIMKGSVEDERFTGYFLCGT